MNPAPEIRSTRPLADNRVSPPAFVPTTIIRRLPPARLSEVEAVWSPARQELAAVRDATGSELESSHWNWLRKVERVAQGELLLFAVECDGAVQGLMAIPALPRPSVLMPSQSILYVDYLEAAPWNQRAPGRLPRFLGAGSALIAEAITVSMEFGLGGRVGLHSLSQAERFYEVNCGMTRVGTDPSYYDLVYFEYTEAAGTTWLAARTSDDRT